MGKRSSMFFESDLRAAAETVAFDMERHGLHPEDVTELAETIQDAIRNFFAPLREAEAALDAHDHRDDVFFNAEGEVR